MLDPRLERLNDLFNYVLTKNLEDELGEASSDSSNVPISKEISRLNSDDSDETLDFSMHVIRQMKKQTSENMAKQKLTYQYIRKKKLKKAHLKQLKIQK